MAKSRRLCTDHQLLTWYVLGVQLEPDATRDRLHELAMEHKADWALAASGGESSKEKTLCKLPPSEPSGQCRPSRATYDLPVPPPRVDGVHKQDLDVRPQDRRGYTSKTLTCAPRVDGDARPNYTRTLV